MKKMKRALTLLALALSLIIPTAVSTTTTMIGIFGTVETASAAVRIDRSKTTIYIGQTQRLKLAGTATITAKISKKKYTCKVTVKAYDGDRKSVV